jgi:hypothetical protein
MPFFHLMTQANLRKLRKIKFVFFRIFVIHHTIPSYTIFDVALILNRHIHKTSHLIHVYNYNFPPIPENIECLMVFEIY